MSENKSMVRGLAELFLTFAKIGVMTFGGGYAMLPILQREIVENKGWADEAEMADYYAIGQCTPGIIAVNVATFIGRKRMGAAGAVAATLGEVFPCLVIISVIAGILTNFADLPVVQNAFGGIRACVCVLILNAVIKLLKTDVVDVATLVIFLAVMIAAAATSLSPVWFVVAAAAAGIGLRILGIGRKKGGDAQ